MFKKFTIALAILFSATAVFSADTKIGVVDVQMILSKAPQVKAIGERVQAQYKDRIDALAALQKKGVNLQDKLKRDGMTLTKQQKREMQRELQTIDNSLKMKQNFLQQDIKVTNAEEQAKFYKRVQQAIDKIAKDEKFDMILNKEAVPFVNAKLDISNKVLKIISNPAS